MRKIVTFTVTTLLMASAFGAGEVYRWRGADGAWHYSDQPRAGAELVQGPQASRTAATEETPEAATPAPVASSQDMPVSDAVAEEVRAEADAQKAAQCKKATAGYDQALKARRIYKVDAQGKQLVGADGKPVFMTSAEIDAERLQARSARDFICGSGS